MTCNKTISDTYTFIFCNFRKKMRGASRKEAFFLKKCHNIGKKLSFLEKSKEKLGKAT